MNFEILVATNNEHKLKEIRSILSPHKITVYGFKDLNIKEGEVTEDGKTYFENALIKAKSAARATKIPIIADDSGLEVVALNNAPGLYSARFAKECGGHNKAMRKIIDEIKGKSQDARFVCDIVLINVEDKPLLFEGITTGRIAKSPEGENGFGYDPIFICDDLNKNYALLTEEEKNEVSHRAKALKKLLTYLRINGYAH
ncbi:MAG: RdgB/HAM1 family non-canonical purine NTP pyrophosphatase [Bacilli bacterium]|nr:RdgB/HAM1 family non-canonical purine NTP pyrophosphatase [Bacilli bacterium]